MEGERILLVHAGTAVLQLLLKPQTAQKVLQMLEVMEKDAMRETVRRCVLRKVLGKVVPGWPC